MIVSILAVCLTFMSVVAIRRNVFSSFVLFAIAIILGVCLRYFYIDDPVALDGAYWLRISYLIKFPIIIAVFDIALFCAAAFAAFYFATPKFKRGSALRFQNLFPEVASQSSWLLMAVLLAAIWAFILVRLIAIFGSLDHAFFIFQKRALLFGSDVVIVRSLLFFTLTYLALLISSPVRRGAPFVITASLIALTAFHLWFVFQTGARGHTIMHAFVLGVCWFRTKIFRNGKLISATRVFPVFIAGVLASAAVIVLGATVRDVAQTGIPWDIAVERNFASSGSTISNALPILDLYSAARNFSDVQGHDFGQQFVGYVTRFIPRDIWPEKPLVLGLQMRQFYSGNILSGVPPTVMGEFYIAFGYFGLVLGGAVFGCALAIIDELWMLVKSRPSAALTAPFLACIVGFSFCRAGMEIGVFLILYVVLAALLGRFVLGAVSTSAQAMGATR